MGFEDPSGTMGNTLADKMDRLEAMPLVEQKKFDEGLQNYMVKNQFTWQKVVFIRKTYGILLVWLFISYLISLPFMRDEQGTVDWFANGHSWILWLAAVVLFLQIAFYLVVIGFLLAGGQNLPLLVYIKLMNAFPSNYAWALLYVSSFSLIVNAALAAFGVAQISCVFLYTFIAVLGLLLYTYAVRNCDFKQLYGYVVPVATAVLIACCLRLFGDDGHFLEHFVGLIISIVLGWIVMYDTQLIFGARVERGRKYPYQSRMYAMAAYEIYFDAFIHFYLGALNLFPAGQSDDPLSAQ